MGSRVHLRRAILAAVTVAAAIPVMGPAAAEESSTTCPPVTIADLEEEARESEEPETSGGLDTDVDGSDEPSPSSTTTTTVPEPECDAPFVYPMVFPLLGRSGIGSPFGAARDGGARLHQGNDLFGPHLQPVVAVADGTITRMSADEGISGYRIGISHDDGWYSLYIHLNNDTAGTDDGDGIGIRQDLRLGDRVSAGELIGWNGDSGNAEGTTHHLHFELHDPSGTPVDPEASLDAALRTTDALGDQVLDIEGPFVDVPNHEQAEPLLRLLSEGVPVWCDGTRVKACPDDRASPQDITAWLAALLRPPVPPHVEGAVRPETPPVTTYFPLCAEEGECEESAVTELDLARVVVWDMLGDAFDASRSYRAASGTPDASWTTPSQVPPDDPAALTTGRVLEVLGNTGLCPVIDESTPLTRRRAAEFLIRDLWAQCPTSANATDATR